EQIPVRELWKDAEEGKFISLRMKPINDELKKHVDEVSVVLEIATGLVLRAQTVDTDGDRLLMIFSNIRTSTGVKDSELEMDVPAGVKESRPLEGAPAK